MTAAVPTAGTGWSTDLLLGLRLAFGARRSAWLRLALTALGTGVGVVVLLFAASAPHVVHRHSQRADALMPVTTKVAGVSQLTLVDSSTTYHGDSIGLKYVHPTGPNAPVPPGLRRLPGPGEVVLSPALATLLNSSDGALLRPRIPGTVVSTIGRAGLSGPADLVAYLGMDGPLRGGFQVYGFGDRVPPNPAVPLVLWMLLVVGVVVLLFPVFVFVVTAARLSGAERDRRLAAIRLIGADGRQIRRIAAGEAVLGSVAGLLIGAGLFLALRPLVQHQTLSDVSVFAQDVVPSLPLIIVIVLAIPTLAVAATLFALRRTMIEPLGVVRQGSPTSRRLWWRLGPVLIGAALLVVVARSGTDRPSAPVVICGVVLLLLGIPVLLPWILQRVVGRAHRGTPPLQLATGRLRLDSGTPARVVAGVAVVLAGSIALFSLLAASEKNYGIPNHTHAGAATVELQSGTAAQADQLAATIGRLPGIKASVPIGTFDLSTSDKNIYQAAVLSCTAIAKLGAATRCHNGAVFDAVSQGTIAPNTRVRLEGNPGDPGSRGAFRMPVMSPLNHSGVLLPAIIFTPGALRGVHLPKPTETVVAKYPANRSEEIERIRNAAAPLQWRAYVWEQYGSQISTDQKTFSTIRRGLLSGSLLTLGMAGATMLVLAIEQIRERRRPLAVLAASGVPRSMLARSVLWQNAIPLALAVLVADATGLVLGSLLLRIVHEQQRIDWSAVGLLTAAAVAAVAVATALTLPAVRKATRPETLRAE